MKHCEEHCKLELPNNNENLDILPHLFYYKSFQNIYQSNEYELEKKAIEEAQEWFKDESFLEFLPEEYRSGQGAYDGEEGQEESRRGGIEVEEIKIGE